MFLEQLAGIRPKGGLSQLRRAKLRFDIPKRLRAVLVRRDLLTHVKSSFPMMEQYTKTVGTWGWHKEVYNLAEDGTNKDGKPFRRQDCTALDEEDEDCTALGKDSTVLDPFAMLPEEKCSTYQCYTQLVGFCTELMQNHHELTLCKLVPNFVPGKALNLAGEDAMKIKEILTEIKAKYDVDFPARAVSASVTSHKMTHSVSDGSSLEVTTHQKIENVDEYRAELAKYHEQATNHEQQAIKEYLDHRVVLIVDNLESGRTQIAQKLAKYPLIREKKRKLYIYDCALDGPLNWTAIKKRRLSVWAGAGPGLCEERLKAGRVENYQPVGKPALTI